MPRERDFIVSIDVKDERSLTNATRNNVRAKQLWSDAISGRINEDELEGIILDLFKCAIRSSSNDISRYCWWGTENMDNLDNYQIYKCCILPSYYITATIIYAFNHNERIRKFQDFRNVLNLGLEFCTINNLYGYGMERNVERENALTIYRAAGAYDFIETEPDINVKFTALLKYYQKNEMNEGEI